MEPRANHLLVGAFVILAVVVAFVITIWLARVQGGPGQVPYQVYFRGSVQGLGVGAEVRYRGIRVGSIREINIDPQDPTRVSVVIAIDAGTPIREGDTAVLEYQGLTGIATINIGGATVGSPPLEPEPDQDMAVIPSMASSLEQLVEGAPQLLELGMVLMGRATELLQPENLQRISAILANAEVFTGELADQREQITKVLTAAERSSEALADTVAAVRDVSLEARSFLRQATITVERASSTLAHLDRVASEDLDHLVSNLNDAASSVESMAREGRALMVENRAPLNAFASDGLGEISRLVAETRLLVSSLSRLTERIERDGARFLFGRPDSEFNPP